MTIKSKLIQARFAGRCRGCGTTVTTADQVWFAKHYGVRCQACGPHPDDAERLPSKSKGKARRSPSTTNAKKSRRKAALPDPTKGGGAMPGENCAAACADDVWRYEFNSVSDAVRDALDDYAQNAGTQEFLRERLKHALSGKDSWANRFTESKLLRELSSPSAHLLEAVDRMRERLIGEVDTPSMPRRRVRRGQEFGEELDSDRYLAHSLSPWDRNVRDHQSRRTVTIGCNLSINAGAKPEQLLYRGAAALALADLLTSRGVNVGIVLFDSRKDPTRSIGRSVIRHNVKDPLMPLDLSAVAFSMCEIAFFRVVCALGGMRHMPGVMNESLGYAASLPGPDAAGLDYLIESDVLSEEAATQWLTSCMAGAESEVCHV